MTVGIHSHFHHSFSFFPLFFIHIVQFSFFILVQSFDHFSSWACIWVDFESFVDRNRCDITRNGARREREREKGRLNVLESYVTINPLFVEEYKKRRKQKRSYQHTCTTTHHSLSDDDDDFKICRPTSRTTPPLIAFGCSKHILRHSSKTSMENNIDHNLNDKSTPYKN